MSYSRVFHKTPLMNEYNKIYEMKGALSYSTLKTFLHSRFIAEGVYGLEKYFANGYKDEYLLTPSFDPMDDESIQKEWSFANEDVKEISLYELVLKKPIFMPLHTTAFLDLWNKIEMIPHASVFTQLLFCKRRGDWRETVINQYESWLRGVDRPLEGKFSIKIQESFLNMLNKINHYQSERERIEEMEAKILSHHFRFEWRFLVFEQKFAKGFETYLREQLAKLQFFNEFTLRKVPNKKSFLKILENRQFQPELVNQLLSEQEMYSLLCDHAAAQYVPQPVVTEPIRELNATRYVEDKKVIPFPVERAEKNRTVSFSHLEKEKILAQASSFMPYSEQKEVVIDQEKVKAINQAFRRVGIVNKLMEVTHVYQGASLLKVQMEVPPEITYTSITKKIEDIRGAMGNKNITIEIGEKPDTVNIYIPLANREPVYFNHVLISEDFGQFKENNLLPFIIGESINGGYLYGDLTKLRHLLISGTTGSGKSVFVCLIILCLLLSVPPEQLVLYLIDPKMVEFAQFKSFPQVKAVITDMRKANSILTALVSEMESRYELFSQSGCRDIQGYNLKNEHEKMPYVVTVIDELADLMMVNKSVEEDIVRLCQKARGAGIHLIIATQRPSVDVVTGLIKANMPSRIAFAVSSGTDSKTILDRVGAERLLGLGDGLAKIEGSKHEFERFQGPVLTLDKTEEQEIYEKIAELFEGVNVEGELSEPKEEDPLEQLKTLIATTGETRVAELAKSMTMATSKVQGMIYELVDEGWLKKEGKSYVIALTEEELGQWKENNDPEDERLEEAIELVREMQTASISMIQRRFLIGYTQAARLMDKMEKMGVVGPYQGSQPREVLIK